MRTKLLLAGLLILGMAACQQSPPLTQLPTITPLIGKLTFAGSTTVQPLAALLGDAFQELHPKVELDIAAGGSKVGIQAIHDGTVDIGMASRALTPEESQGLTQYQIAVDVIAIVVHADNPVGSLTLEQIRAIYMGEIANWQEVGGPDQAIVPVTREQTSGTRGAFDDLVLEKQAPAAARLKTVVTAGDMAAAVTNDPASIGYVGFGNIESALRVVAINGVAPSKETATSGAYPLIRPLFFLTGPLSQPLADQFIGFALSAEGQQLVEEAGWVPVK
jgi:phosphate transport system substrate-binding protein